MLLPDRMTIGAIAGEAAGQQRLRDAAYAAMRLAVSQMAPGAVGATCGEEVRSGRNGGPVVRADR